MADTKLAELGFWPQSAVKRLAEQWIDTAAQLVAIASSPESIEAISRQTGLPTAEVVALIERTRLSLPEAELKKLSPSVDTTNLGRGALKPEKK